MNLVAISPHGLLHITPPQTTTPIIHCTYDTHIPIHHCTNHTAVTNHSLAMIVSPHLHLIHTHTYKQYTSMHSPRSLVLAPADISERYPSCCLLSLCLTPDCPTLELWTCACDPDFCLKSGSLYCLRLCPASDIPVFARWPLPVWFCLCQINILLHMDPHAFDQSLQFDSHITWALISYIRGVACNAYKEKL